MLLCHPIKGNLNPRTPTAAEFVILEGNASSLPINCLGPNFLQHKWEMTKHFPPVRRNYRRRALALSDPMMPRTKAPARAVPALRRKLFIIACPGVCAALRGGDAGLGFGNSGGSGGGWAAGRAACFNRS